MATKLIYFTMNGTPEQAEFLVDCPAEDVKDLFRCAAEAGPHDILKLYNPKGNIINISPSLEPNSPNSCYKLEVVAADSKTAELAVALGFDLSSMDKRLQGLEKNILIEAGETPAVVYEMKKQVDSFQEKLEVQYSVKILCKCGFKSVEHLSWLGLFKDLSEGTHKPSPFYHKRTLHKTRKECEHVLHDNVSRCHAVLLFISEQMYGLIWLTDLKSKMDSVDLLIMLTCAVCHDLDHTGYNNAYQINARTELALRYNDISPLENHHCAVAFEILEKTESNIFRNLSMDQYKRIREGIIKCILATDMTRHNEILNRFKSILPAFDFTNKDHREVLMMILIKVSDISNEARPMEVAEPWLDCLLQEFYNQSDKEKLEGLPVTPFMDRDKVNKPSSQTGFIRFVLLPLFIELANLFPCLEQHIIDPVRKALDYYTEMEKALEREKQIRAQSENAAKSKETTVDTQSSADSHTEALPEASKPDAQ
ncbi:high affinity cGMP-specific 3',5'-cyclic phosphodiesterase 9A [Anarhichas minor]|uniref:high affinity cGMP-specific 3',5'-cyclic phosphodiesterase 9A n=1 Tax=Anarhichas minor TaxID=65739 RepID=UPI003F73CEA0